MAGSPLFVGTSGFSYAHWKNGVFYPKGMPSSEWFSFFTRHFDTVEINLTFYRPVAATTLERWKAIAPPEFRFTMKASKQITHFRRLLRCEEPLRDLWEQFAPLGERLACVLFQLPPSMKLDADRLSSFASVLDATRKDAGADCDVALEFRHSSWYVPDVFALARDRGYGIVLHDMPYKGGFWPIEGGLLKGGKLEMPVSDWVRETAPLFSYLRFHGNVGRRAWQEYGEEELRPWTEIATACRRNGKTMYAYFNNDPGGAAIRDAMLFRDMLVTPATRGRQSKRPSRGRQPALIP